MLLITTPGKYLNAPDLTKTAGQWIKNTGRRPLIIGGETALRTVGEDFFESLRANGIETGDVYTFKGFPSEKQFQYYTETALNQNNDMIIGIGGGRVMDTAKAVGNLAGLPIVTVPTVAATCAAWAAVTIQYDDEGAFVKFRDNPRCADLILADTKILISSPARYLNSGIVDTFAKYYETVPLWGKHRDNLTADINLYISKLALDKLEEYAVLAVKQAENDIFGTPAIQVVDTIIYLAGLTGSLMEDYGHYSFAHPFYHTSTRLAHTRHKLHGEKVAFGILAQLFLQGIPEEEIAKTAEMFRRYHALFTLEDLGIKENREDDLVFLAKDIIAENPHLEWSEAQIIRALVSADTYVNKYREGKNNGR